MRAFLRKAGDQLIRRRFDGVSGLTAGVYASLVDYLVSTGDISTRPFDATACLDAKISDLSPRKVSEFLARAKAERQYPLGAKTPMLKALAHLDLLDGGRPTHAAILLFGKKPQRFLITSEVKCLHFHGTEIAKPIPSYQIFKGTVFDLVDQSVDFVLSKINVAVGPRDEGPRAPVTYELPTRAVAEAIVNAVSHRDYASNASVQVMLFSDRLEVWNPGELPPPLTTQSLRGPHASIPRNPLIAGPLYLTRYSEKAGTGILDMIQRCKDAGLPTPEFRQDMGQFIQILRRPKPAAAAADTKVPATAQVAAQVTAQVAAFCRVPRSAKEIMAVLGLKHWKTFQSNYLVPLMKVGVLVRTIPDKPQSRLQRYRTTVAGEAALKKSGARR
jgi:predicted HTH transcriptional regulator